VLSALVLALALASADDDARNEDEGYWTFAAVPRLTINSDDGFGLGARGTAFWHRFHTKPYKTALSFQAWITTRLVQHHYVKIDALDAFNLSHAGIGPLRLEGEAGYFQSLTQNYCGLGDRVECSESAATQLRFLSPYVATLARLRVAHDTATGARVEPFAGWRGTYYVPGSLFDARPYPGSVYARAFPQGEPGFASVLQAGVIVDARDREPTPSHGYVLEMSARASSPLMGSAWDFRGVNATARLYSPVATVFGREITLAQRGIVDVLDGAPPVMELARVGGTADAYAYGGQDVGRGVRVQRFLGRIKAVVQEELRVDVVHVDLWGNDAGLVVAPFVDAGFVFVDARDVVDDRPRLLWGGGIALRASWNDAFVMRLDLAMSPIEGLRVGVYTAPGHPY
jgi:hypothetical protein